MGFKVLEVRGRGAKRTFYVQGETKWSLLDLIPYMLEVSKHSRDYALVCNLQGEPFFIVDKRDRENRRASLTLEATLDPKINRVHVLDAGVGTQMINKYLRSIEKPRK